MSEVDMFSAGIDPNMATEDFENFYYDVCTLDYKKMSEAMDSLVDLYNKTKNIIIRGIRLLDLTS